MLKPNVDLAYIIGFIQIRRSKARNRRALNLEVRACHPNLNLVRKRIRRLGDYVSENQKDGYISFYISSGNIEDVLDETENLKHMPRFVLDDRRRLRAYLRGVFDSKGRIDYVEHRIKHSSFPRRFVRIEVCHSRGKILLAEIVVVLKQEFNIEARLNIRSDAAYMRINKQDSLWKLVNNYLVSDPKRKELRRALNEHAELIAIDAYGRLKRLSNAFKQRGLERSAQKSD